jgi:pyruvate ferredoxin oxidoreductase beta subunit
MEDQYIKFGKNHVPKEELLCRGHRGCHGCGLFLTVRLCLKALGRNIVISVPPSCLPSCIGIFPEHWWRVCWIHTDFASHAAVASGVEVGYRILMEKGIMADRDIHSVIMAGDGGTADIGLQALSGAIERDHNFLYICTDNEAYMNTGINRSSVTPYGAETPTSPVGKDGIGKPTWKKNMPAIIAAHDIPYAATVCASYPFDLMNKVKRGRDVKGPAYIHALTVCPTGWRAPPDLTVKIGQLAVETGTFPLYEIENGHYKLNVDRKKLKPVEEYLKTQGRFSHLPPEEKERIQKKVDEEYARLKTKVGTSPAL